MTFVTFLMTQNRPVNINLFKIKLPLSAFLSITHRISGILIFFIVLPVSAYTLSLIFQNQESYNTFLAYYSNNLSIKLTYLFLVLIFQYHIFTGIRHMLMDFHLLEESLSVSHKSAVLTIFVFVINVMVTAWVMLWI